MTIPRSLGRYEVIELLGYGGMAALYRARDPRIGRFVAIKQLRPQFDTPELRDRFSREAAAAGGLSHPNIVTIYDVGEDDGLPFIAMEFVQGETFADLVKLRPPLAIPRKIQLTEEVCAGLAHAHEAGIVHRDIKPANLIVGPEGIVKILDFGVAKLIAGGTTLPGAIIGTLNYMSPEQIRGTTVDARADIFSVGAVLYEMLSHRQAFPGHVPDDVFQSILHSQPTPLGELAPGLDVRLIDLVQCSIEKDPDERPQDISALQKELAIVRLSLQASEPQRSVPRRTVAGGSALQTPPPIPPGAQQPPMRGDAALEEKRAKQIAAHLADAERAYESGDYDAAIESCKQALLLDELEERAILLLDRIHAAIDEQQERDRLLERDRQRDASIRLGIEEARRRFAGGQHELALAALADLGPSSHPLVAEALEDLQRAFDDILEERRIQAEHADHQRRVQALLDEGQMALRGRRLDEAERLLERLRELDAGALEASGFAERVSDAQAAARLNSQIAGLLRDFDECLAHEDLSKAADGVEAIRALAPNDGRVRAAQTRLEQARADLAAREAAEAKRREAEQQLGRIAGELDNGDLGGAAEQLASVAAILTAGHPGVAELSARLRKAEEERAAAEALERIRREVADLLASASRRHESAGDRADELREALRDVQRALTLSAANVDAVNLKTSIKASLAALHEAARMKAVIGNARTRFANGKYQAAIRLLEEFQPTNPEIDAVLTEFRDAVVKLEEERRLERERAEKQKQVATLLESARQALAAQRFESALENLASAESIDAAAPELAALADRIRQEQETARLNVEMERLLADLNDRLAGDDLTAAMALLESAETRAPADQRVQLARQRVDRAVAAHAAAEALAREAEEQCVAAETAFENGEVDRAAKSLTRALAADPQHARALALSGRVNAALEEQAALEAARRRRQTIDDLLAVAASHLQKADLDGDAIAIAIQTITEALALDSAHEQAVALKATAENALNVQRQARAAVRNARNRSALGKHHAAIQLLEGLEPALQPLVARTLGELRETLAGIEERRRRETETAGDGTVLIPLPAADADNSTRESSQNRGGIWRPGIILALGFVLLAILIVLYRFRTH